MWEVEIHPEDGEEGISGWEWWESVFGNKGQTVVQISLKQKQIMEDLK